MIRECSTGMYHDPERGFTPQKIPTGKTLFDLELEQLYQEARYFSNRDIRLSGTIEVGGNKYKTDDQTKTALVGRTKNFKFKSLSGIVELTPDDAAEIVEKIIDTLDEPRDRRAEAEEMIKNIASMSEVTPHMMQKYWEGLQ